MAELTPEQQAKIVEGLGSMIEKEQAREIAALRARLDAKEQMYRDAVALLKDGVPGSWHQRAIVAEAKLAEVEREHRKAYDFLEIARRELPSDAPHCHGDFARQVAWLRNTRAAADRIAGLLQPTYHAALAYVTFIAETQAAPTVAAGLTPTYVINLSRLREAVTESHRGLGGGDSEERTYD